jgi:hypothetical protein
VLGTPSVMSLDCGLCHAACCGAKVELNKLNNFRQGEQTMLLLGLVWGTDVHAIMIKVMLSSFLEAKLDESSFIQLFKSTFCSPGFHHSY